MQNLLYAVRPLDEVRNLLLKRIETDGVIHMLLLDPEKLEAREAGEVALQAEKIGTSAIMIGGTTLASMERLNAAVKAVKAAVKVPVILFPSNITGISPYADAVWYMSLLNSANPYFIIEAQALAAPIIKQYKLEPIPMGYIIVGEGGAAGFIGQARLIPYRNPELATLYALAAQFLGMQFIYLEAGSGASQPVPETMVSKVKHAINIPLIVGGGIRTGQHLEKAVMAGADIIVTSTVVEEKQGSVEAVLTELMEALRKAAEKRQRVKQHGKFTQAE